jgi:hypothetical protein
VKVELDQNSIEIERKHFMFKNIPEPFVSIHVLTMIVFFALFGQTQSLAETKHPPEKRKHMLVPKKTETATFALG